MIFKGKRVVIIGPAPQITEIMQRELIDNYDVVVRINEALPVPFDVRRATGSRCDVLYVWRRVKLNSYMANVKEVRLKSDAIWQPDWVKDNHINYKEKIVLIHPNHFYKLQEKLHCRPNTGLVAIEDIMADEPKELYITGITFYQAGSYYSGYVSDVRKTLITKLKGNKYHHQQEPQLWYFKNHFYPMPQIKVDPVLKNIVENYGK